MNKKQVQKLKSGLYRIHWKYHGGSSLAAVGADENGNRWLAPCNWIGGIGAKQVWGAVQSAELIRSVLDEAQS